MNDAGHITGFVIGPDNVMKGFVATLPGLSGYQAVTLPATQLFVVPGIDAAPQAINNGGRIVGFGSNATGLQDGFVAAPIAADKD